MGAVYYLDDLPDEFNNTYGDVCPSLSPSSPVFSVHGGAPTDGATGQSDWHSGDNNVPPDDIYRHPGQCVRPRPDETVLQVCSALFYPESFIKK